VTLSREERVEQLAAEFHEVYQVEAKRQGDVRHADAYADLSENIKEFDRVLARHALDALEAAEQRTDDLGRRLALFANLHAEEKARAERAEALTDRLAEALKCIEIVRMAAAGTSEDRLRQIGEDARAALRDHADQRGER